MITIKEKDAVMQEFLSYSQEINFLTETLKDASRSGIVLVMNAKKLILLEMERVVSVLQKFNLPIAGIIINHIFHLNPELCEEKKEEEAIIPEIKKEFPDIPLIKSFLILSPPPSGVKEVREVWRYINMTEFPLLLILFLAAGLVALWFYQGRRINLRLIYVFSKEVEEAIKPIDQTYLGGYVGFRVEYKLHPLQPDINITITLLLFPFNLLWLRHDRLYAILPWKTSIPGEAHLIRKGFLLAIPQIEGIMNYESWQGKGMAFDIWYKHRLARDVLISLIQRLEKPERIPYLALVSGPNHLYCFMKPKEGEIGKTIKVLMAIRQ